MAKIKTIDHTSCGENMEQLELSYTAGNIHKMFNHFGKQFGIFLKTKYKSPFDAAILTPRYLVKRKQTCI